MVLDFIKRTIHKKIKPKIYSEDEIIGGIINTIEVFGADKLSNSEKVTFSITEVIKIYETGFYTGALAGVKNIEQIYEMIEDLKS